MYNKMGLKLKEHYKKNVLTKKMTVFLTFSLPKFSIASVCTVLVNNFMLTVQQFEVPTVMAKKLSILKANEGLNIRENCISENCQKSCF